MRSHPGLVPGVVHGGQILAGKYRVDRVLGMGGMGVVVAAQHVDLETRVALKFLLPDSVSDKDAVERFTREAKAAVSLKSEHTVRVFDTGKLDDGAPYMVMELLVGQNLAEVLAEQRRLQAAEAVDYVLQACEAIAEAHAKGLVHRDIKPSNLFRTTSVDGRPLIKVLDFGLAKRVDNLGGAGGLTTTTAIMGSPQYMSPEQMRATRDIDARTDIWSLGVCLYELLSGVMPFEGETLLELSASVLKDWARPLADVRPDLPPDLCRVVMHCLAKKPDERFQDVAELARALEAYAPAVSAGALQRISATLSAPRLPVASETTHPRVDPMAPTRTARDFASTLLVPLVRGRPLVVVPIAALVAVVGVAVIVGLARRGGSSAAERLTSEGRAASPALAAEGSGASSASSAVPVSDVPLAELAPTTSSPTASAASAKPLVSRPGAAGARTGGRANAGRTSTGAAPTPAPLITATALGHM